MKKTNNRKNTIIIVAVVSALLSVPLLSNARSYSHYSPEEQYITLKEKHQTKSHGVSRHNTVQPSSHGSHHDGFKGGYESLNDEQKKRLATLDIDFDKKRLPVNAKLQTLHLELKSINLEPTVDKSRIMTIAGEIADLRGELYILNVEQNLAEKDIVTTET